MKHGLTLLLIYGLCAAAAMAAPLAFREKATLINSQADGSLVLDDGKEAVLEGILLPDAAAAGRWLKPHLGKELAYRSLGKDRYGRERVVSMLQPAMVKDGVAIAYSAAALPEIMEWMRHEQTAARNKRGVWGTIVTTPQGAARATGQFRMIEGRVMRLYAAREATYMNFGQDWKTDFSVTIPKRLLRRMGGTLAALEGKTVRVRGMLYEENGPMIRLSQPEQLEVIHAP